MDKRKEELEKKRQKLAELRRQREERKLQLERQKGSPPGSPSAKEKSARQNIDELVNSLVGDTTERTPSQTSSIPDSDKATPGASDAGIMRSDSMEERPATPEPARPKPNLTIQDIVILDLPPKEKVFYNKEIQTVDLEEPPSPEKQKGVDQSVESSPTPEPEISKNEEEEQDKVEVPEISETERQSIIQSDSFKHFLESSTKVLERVLSLEEKQDYDWMKDYTTDFAILKDENKNQKLKPLGKFYDEKLCRGRAVTALDWSPIHPELHLASYNRSTSLGSQTDPDGLICVWNAHVESRPEFVFNSQSDILSSIFHPFNPHLIISATYTGQILIYDTRSRSTLPSLKTPLSVLGHTHPIYGMKYVGTKNAGTLVTGSTDGAVCGWQLDMLGAAESIELIHPTHPRTEEVSITTLDFPGNETTTFWIGTEEGNLYQGFRYDRAGSKAGLNVFDVYKGHNGMVTSVHFHPANGPIDFSDLILSSSVDWTVRLWRAKSLTKPATTLTTHSPLHTFEEADDYVNDAKWSPVHPALFASVDGTGRVDLWNLNTDTESPTASHTPSPKALNKVAWDTEGKKISVGGNDGTVYVYEVHNDVAVPVADDWFLLQRKLQELERQNEDGRVGK